MAPRTIQEILSPLTDFPHMPYWFSVRQAITMLRLAAEEPAKAPPRMVLVFDEKYQLLGTLEIEDILRGLEPRYLSATSRGEGVPFAGATAEELAVLWADSQACREAADRPVKDCMAPVTAALSVGDPIARAASQMLTSRSRVLAVMDGRKVAGVVKLEDVYEAITSAVVNA